MSYARPRDLRIGAFAEYIAIDHADIALKRNVEKVVEKASRDHDFERKTRERVAEHPPLSDRFESGEI